MGYLKVELENYVVALHVVNGSGNCGKDKYEALKSLFLGKPQAPDGYQYKLRADNLEWELVAIEPEPLTDEEALTRYANSFTGASDQTLIEAAETLITEKIKEEH